MTLIIDINMYEGKRISNKSTQPHLQVINVLTVLSIYVPQLTHDQCWVI